FYRIAIAAQEEPHLEHLAEFEIILPVVRFLQERGEVVIVDALTAAVRPLAKESPGELGHILRDHGDARHDGGGVERGDLVDLHAGDGGYRPHGIAPQQRFFFVASGPGLAPGLRGKLAEVDEARNEAHARLPSSINGLSPAPLVAVPGRGFWANNY